MRTDSKEESSTPEPPSQEDKGGLSPFQDIKGLSSDVLTATSTQISGRRTKPW
jgi:hypothetical protein